ncbi:Ribose-phosphate pyrophosphokinase 4 [Linum perenne]
MDEEGDVATAFTLARILSNIPISRGGPTSLVVYDIHALQVRFVSFQIVIAFPDDGAWKRFHNLLDDYPTEGDKRIVRIKEGNPAGFHVVIVDDLVQSGGTLIECQKVLAAHGAAKVSAYVTHGVFPKRSWERFTHKNNGNSIHASFISNSVSCPASVNK